MVAPLLVWGGVALGFIALTSGKAPARASGTKAVPVPAPSPAGSGVVMNPGAPAGVNSSGSGSGSSPAPPPPLEYSENASIPNEKTNLGEQVGGALGAIAGGVGALVGKLIGKGGDALYSSGTHLDPAAVKTFNEVENFQSTIPQPIRSAPVSPGFDDAHAAYTQPVAPQPEIVFVPLPAPKPAPAPINLGGGFASYNPSSNVTSGGKTSTGAPAQNYAGTGASAGVSGAGDAGSGTGGSGD